MRATTKRVTITIDVHTTSRAETVEKWGKETAQKLLDAMVADPEWKGYAEVSLQGTRAEKWPPEPKSRATQLSDAASAIQGAASDAEGIKDGLESWRDNLPESFQEKADELKEAIDAIEEAIEKANEAAGELESVEVPGAFGR